MTIKQQGGIFGRNPTFNDLTAGSGSSIEGSGGNATFSVNRTDASTAGALVLYAKGGTVGIDSNGADKDLTFSTAGQTERARFFGDKGGFWLRSGSLIVDSGQGIDFSATSGTGTSELFSDYEEGTWTPVISDGTNNGTSNVVVGTYIKTGNHVHVQGRVRLSSLGSVSGAVRLTGLPFASKTLSNNFGVMVVGRAAGLNVTVGTAVYGDLRSNVDYVNLIINDATVGTSNLQDTEFTADGDISFSMDYISN